jgi:phosphate transport system substrate-binding protein
MRLVITPVGIFRLALSALVLASLSGHPSKAATQPAAALVVAGSSTLAPLMTDIARRFETRNRGVAIEIHSIGSGPGVSELRAGRCDIGMISRPVADNERDLFAFPIARDGASVVVHRTNAVGNLTSRQLTDILTGRITDWKQLGGRPGLIRVAWRTEGQGVPELLLQQLKLRNDQVHSHALFFENADAVKYAADNRGAIAFAALGVAERMAKSGVAIKLLAYEGVPASNRTLRDHTYALSRPLILLTRSVPDGLHKRLIEYATSKAVADLHEKHNFVPYSE